MTRWCPRLSPGPALARLVDRLRPFHPKGERGRPSLGLERMLRIYLLQQWYALADEALEDALYDSQALRGFAGIDLLMTSVPDATTVLNLRHWLERAARIRQPHRWKQTDGGAPCRSRTTSADRSSLWIRIGR
jgi:hypothetical protein